ncbi:MAG: type II toxin-antitoxin system RelE/ParE family toxin [Sedimentisphaerales bacterium]|nr:type II toxin-antitoxin system RelE/ParE family toxin [Sedimentisphaerales bacterium]
MATREYRIYIDESAIKSLGNLPKKIQRQICRKIETLATNPRPQGSQKIRGVEGDYFRIKSGNYRIIYQVDDEKITVFVVRIADRKEVYRRLRKR